jgi:2-dehydropantoate 2-reductase
MADVAVIGSGGIGGILAAELARAGRDVVVCVRTPFETLSVEHKGETRTAPVTIATEPGAAGPVPVVLVTTKAQDTASAAPWFGALVGPGTIVVVVQNGIDQETRVAGLPDGTRVVPAIIYCSVERTAPGRIVHHASAKLVVPASEPGAAVVALFEGTMFEVVQDPAFRTAAWRKLLSNVAANAITSLTLRRVRVFADDRVRALAKGLLAEAASVARADGADITDADVDGVVANMGRLNPDGGTSMLYDRLAGRPLEHDYITGAVVAAAERHGVEAPLNRAIYALLGAASGGRLDGSR